MDWNGNHEFECCDSFMVATTYSRLFNYRIGIHLLQAKKTKEVDTIAIHSTLHFSHSKTRNQGTTTNHFRHKKNQSTPTYVQCTCLISFRERIR
jgi:hypothetical protein